MSISKSKNLERKLNNIAKEATDELNRVCGSSLWESLGFIFFDEVPDFYTWTGAILIFGSTTYIAVREARLKRYSVKND